MMVAYFRFRFAVSEYDISKKKMQMKELSGHLLSVKYQRPVNHGRYKT